VQSCIYNGWVRHRRYEPTGHEFRYRLFMMYLDLAELPRLFDSYWCWSTRRAALARFRRADYHGDASQSLDAAVRDSVARTTGRRPTGRIRALMHLRYFGYVFNPVTFYYCFDEAGSEVETILAEITNTPWKERHAYALPVASAQRTGRAMRFRFDKQFHVSPFSPMDMQYDWRFTPPADDLHVHMENLREGRKAFDATLTMERQEISSASLAAALTRYPLVTAKVTTGIYWQALRLWLKRMPFYANPSTDKERNKVTT
jgi:uncharacterized protein